MNKMNDNYNDRMKERLLTINSPGKSHKDHTKEPQKRFAKVSQQRFAKIRIKERIKIVLQPRRSKGVFVIDLRELDNQ